MLIGSWPTLTFSREMGRGIRGSPEKSRNHGQCIGLHMQRAFAVLSLDPRSNNACADSLHGSHVYVVRVASKVRVVCAQNNALRETGRLLFGLAGVPRRCGAEAGRRSENGADRMRCGFRCRLCINVGDNQMDQLQ